LRARQSDIFDLKESHVRAFEPLVTEIATAISVTGTMKHEGSARCLTREGHQSLGAYPRLAAIRAAPFADDLGEIIAPMARPS
jgi:hypothetical protein